MVMAIKARIVLSPIQFGICFDLKRWKNSISDQLQSSTICSALSWVDPEPDCQGAIQVIHLTSVCVCFREKRNTFWNSPLFNLNYFSRLYHSLNKITGLSISAFTRCARPTPWSCCVRKKWSNWSAAARP